ncbi:phage tail assembly protein [Verminephrobacter aporrectodeae subsp. tuberculatae]|uniref:Phage tail assembly protein n=1 Tax=Verminephrobacter aporrectodeae subsp. tuberculatae TaxID=1110392 RepID=A0ABT3KMT4_9BURK|nr:phage tail assembly protein [Verminephrobacter aporrectodeae]MCW5319619.1 phage tail assembly protein [Verminephrobacter aporrectodeae subsp. tuberculatae]
MSKTSNWMSIGPENITVTLSRPSVLNGVRQDKIVMRVPTMSDLRAATKHVKDKEEQEIYLFASLTECAPGDIERLSIRDYNRIQEGFFRHVNEDHADAAQAVGKAAGD